MTSSRGWSRPWADRCAAKNQDREARCKIQEIEYGVPGIPHRAYLSRAARWARLYSELALSMLCPTGEDSAKAYRALVAQEESDELTAALSGRNVPSFLGSKEFVRRVKAGFQSLRSHREIPASRSLAPGLEDLQSAGCASFGLDRKELLSSRRGMSNDARNVAIYLARRLPGQTLAAIGVAFGLENYSSVSSVAVAWSKESERTGA